MRPALFLDRDGTIIVDVGYPRDPARVELLPGAARALRALQAHAALVIVSNQSGLARGKFTRAEGDAVHARVALALAAEGVALAGSYYCWHGPDDGCRCRKPQPGLLRDAARELGLDLARSFIIGDKPSDVDAGRNAGCAAGLLFAADDAPAEARAAADVVGWPAATARLTSMFARLRAADDVE